MQVGVQTPTKNKMDVLPRTSSPDLCEFLSRFVQLAISRRILESMENGGCYACNVIKKKG